jgi:hypothetical protein
MKTTSSSHEDKEIFTRSTTSTSHLNSHLNRPQQLNEKRHVCPHIHTSPSTHHSTEAQVPNPSHRQFFIIVCHTQEQEFDGGEHVQLLTDQVMEVEESVLYINTGKPSSVRKYFSFLFLYLISLSHSIYSSYPAASEENERSKSDERGTKGRKSNQTMIFDELQCSLEVLLISTSLVENLN